jgi:hypothetical protein
MNPYCRGAVGYDIGSSSQIERHDRARARSRRASLKSCAEGPRLGLASPGRRGTACGTHCVIFSQWPDTDVPVLMARMMPARLVEAGYQEVWRALEYHRSTVPDRDA